MSIAAMNWAWAQPLPPSSKLVLMALADAADEAGQCWPRIRVIARKCCVSERTVQRVIKQFERDNVLVVQCDYRDNGAQSSNIYQLRMNPADKMSPGLIAQSGPVDKMSPPPRHACHGGGDIAASPHELPTEPLIGTTTTCAPLAAPPAREELVLPRRLSEGDKPGVMGLLHNVPNVDAQALLDELAAALEAPGMIKTTPGRWFYGVVQKYFRGQFNPVGAPLVAARRAAQAQKTSTKIKRGPVADPAVVHEHLAKIAKSLRMTVSETK